MSTAAERLAAVVREAAGEALATGAATLIGRELEPSEQGVPPDVELHLYPNRPDAAPLWVTVEGDDQATVELGPYRVVLEPGGEGVAALDAAIAVITRAVVAGRYEDWVRSDEDGYDNAKGVIHTEDESITVLNNLVFAWRLDARGFVHTRYAPYVP